MESIVVLLGLGLLLGAVLGWVSFFKIQSLQKQVFVLQRCLLDPTHQVENLGLYGSEIDDLSNNQTASIFKLLDPIAEQPVRANAFAGITKSLENVWKRQPPANLSNTPPVVTSPAALVKKDRAGLSLLSRLRDQWMTWLGGLSTGLSGIFMVRYSIEQGLLGPMSRVLLSIVVGLILHGVAEWGRRRSAGQFQTLAALAGGASIILFAAIAASLNLYDLFPPTFVFIALIFVSLGTMALAVLHGLVLAILGILSVYVIPALVSTGSGNSLSVLMYSTIITVASLLLMRYVYRPWLRAGMLSVHSRTSNGELYTYTIVWLVSAIACLLAGSVRFGANVYRAGFGLMMIVIAKIFLFDMADLESLLRVASFMGLGLSLLGLAYLYQRFNLLPKKAVQ